MSVPKKPSPGSRVALSLGLIVVSVAYALWSHINRASVVSPPTVPTRVSSGLPSIFGGDDEGSEDDRPRVAAPTTPTPLSPSSMMPSPMMGGPMHGNYTDGAYTGVAADAYYGLVKVRATIAGGRVTDVSFLQYPDSHDTSRVINSQAMPLLTQEAIAAQSAQVDIVSGATQTSEAFRASLASALAQASAGGGSASGGKN